jgi:uncharacterized ParB-like nuclease family protein
MKISELLNEVSNVTMYHNPNYFGADVTSMLRSKDDPIRIVPISQLTVFEPLSKTSVNSASLESRKNIDGMMRAIKQGKKLPNITVRKIGPLSYQVIDGHHRLEAYKRAGFTKVQVEIIPKINIKHSNSY